MKKQELFIFVHVPRTAGTTFVRQVEANYKKDELLRLYNKELGLDSNKSYRHEDYLKLVEKKIKKLGKKKKKIKVIYGHRVPCGIHRYFKNREPYYITFLRDPLKRVKSLYNLWYHSYLNLPNQETKKNKFKYGFLVNKNIPDFTTWLESKINLDKMDNIGITQVTFFEKLGYFDNKNINIINLQNKFKHVGFTEDYFRSYIYLSKIIRLNKYSMSENISRRTYVNDIEKSDARKVKCLLKKDIKFYRNVKRLNKDRRPVNLSDKVLFINKVVKSYWFNPKIFVREIFVNFSKL